MGRVELLLDPVFVVAASEARGTLHDFISGEKGSHGHISYWMVSFVTCRARTRFVRAAVAFDLHDWLCGLMTTT